MPGCVSYSHSTDWEDTAREAGGWFSSRNTACWACWLPQNTVDIVTTSALSPYTVPHESSWPCHDEPLGEWGLHTPACA